MGNAHLLRRIRPAVIATAASFRFIVFDLDGTLVDSRRDLADSANALLADCGGIRLPEDMIGRMVGDGAAALVTRAFAAAGCPMPPGAVDRFLVHYDERLLLSTRPYPGIDDVLEQLAARATLAVLTNKPTSPTRRILAGLGLARHFDPSRVMGGDGPAPRKPDPAGLQCLMADAGVRRGDVILVGDSLVDWRTARAADVAVCVAKYGFGFEGFPAAHLTPSDYVVDTPGELLRVL